MEVDDWLEIGGLSAILREHSARGPAVWLPEQMPLNLKRLDLVLRYRDHEYYVYLASGPEEAEKLGANTQSGDWQGWMVRVTRSRNPRGSGQTVSPLPTLEAAIVSALSAVYVMHFRAEARDRTREQRRSAPDSPG